MSFTFTPKQRFWLTVNWLQIAASIAISPEEPRHATARRSAGCSRRCEAVSAMLRLR